MKLRLLLLISIFSSAAIFFLFSILLPLPSLADFNCNWHTATAGGAKRCTPANINCPSGYYTDVNYCKFTNEASCNSAVPQSCIPQPAGGQTSAYNPLCNDGLGVWTAIGCLMAGDPKLFVSQLLGWGAGVGGGIAFLMIIFAGFQIATAAGDPKRVQAAKELLTSAISGLILIVLSVLLLNFIGVKILHLPGFAL